jgi:hypothetical protein
MFPATRIVQPVPYFGKLTYLSHAYASGGSNVLVPTGTRPGDIVFCFSGGFDAGVSTNPGTVATPDNIFNNGYIDPTVFPSILVGFNDGVNGSDEGEGFLAFNTNLVAGMSIGAMYNGASGESNNIFSFGLRDIDGTDRNGKLTLVSHVTGAQFHNTSTVTTDERSFAAPIGSNLVMQNNVPYKDTKLNGNEIMLILLGTLAADNGSTRSDYTYTSGVSTESPTTISEIQSQPYYIGQFGGHFDGYIAGQIGLGTDVPNNSTMRVAYKIIYPDSTETRQYYRLRSTDVCCAAVISRMILRVS